MVKKILIGLVVVIATFLVYAAMRPGAYHVERSATMGAPPDVVLGVVGDFRRFGEWSPWEKIDPAMKRTVEGPPSTVGSSYAWVGNKDAGEGRMSITEVQPDHIGMKWEFIKPWEATCSAAITAVPEGDGSRVTWSMDGTNNYLSKMMSVFVSMDRMIGKDFEKGLAQLKPVAEASAQTIAAATAPAPAAAGDSGTGTQ